MDILKYLKRVLLVVSVLMIVGDSYAASGGELFTALKSNDTAFLTKTKLFEVSEADMSIKYLRAIFGENIVPKRSGNDGVNKGEINYSKFKKGGNYKKTDDSSLLAGMFRQFNLVMWVIVGFMAVYASAITVVSTSQSGDMFSGGQGKMIGWMAVRISAGASFVLPLFSGYSLVQFVVMWVVIKGVGFADSVWGTALDHLKNTGGSIQAVGETNSYRNRKLVLDKVIIPMYKDLVCEGVMQYAYGIKQFGPHKDGGTMVALNNPLNNKEIQIGVKTTSATGDEKDYICGEYSGDATTIGALKLVRGILTPIAYEVAKNAYEKKYFGTLMLLRGQMPGIYDDPDASLAKVGGSDPTTKYWSYARCASVNDCSAVQVFWEAALTSYVSIMTSSKAVDSKRSYSGGAVPGWIAVSKDAGWMSVARYYYDLSSNNAKAAQTRSIKIPDRGAGSDINNYLASYWPKFSQDTSNLDMGGVMGKYSFVNWALPGMDEKLLSKSSESKVTIDAAKIGHNINTAVAKIWQILSKAKVIETKDGDNIVGGIYDYDQKGFFATTIYVGEVEKTTGENYTLEVPRILMTSMLAKVAFAISGINSTETFFGPNDQVTENGINGGADAFKIHTIPSGCDSIAACKASNSNTGYENCLQNLVENKCIMDGDSAYSREGMPNYGLIGGLVASKGGVSSQPDPLMQARALGLDIIDSVTYFWAAVVKNIFDTLVGILKGMIWRVVLTQTLMMIFAALVSLAKELSWAAGPILGSANALSNIMAMNFQLNKLALMLYLPVGMSLSAPLVMVGVALGVYLPLIPFIIFSFSALGWLLVVVEAMIAAPLIAMGVAHPQGHDLLGRSEQAIMLLLGVFLRPVALVIGFLVAIVLSKIGIEIFSVGFLQVFAGAFVNGSAADGTPAVADLIGCFGFLFVYAYVMIELITFCYSSVVQIPDRITRWLGAPEDMQAHEVQKVLGAVGGQAGQLAQETSGTVSGGSGSLGGAQSGATDNAGKKASKLTGALEKGSSKAGANK